MTKERKQEIIKSFGRTEQDTGSPEVQIALLTERINHLTEHLKSHQKDLSRQRRFSPRFCSFPEGGGTSEVL